MRKVGRLNGDLFALKKTHAMVLTNFGLGAPLMAGLAEEFIAWGAKRLVSISMCGGLQSNLGAGDIVVCSRALRDEGTSHHYLPSDTFVSASQALVSSLEASLAKRSVRFQSGATWTTDATFRETEAEVRHYQGMDIKTVEMETAGLFAVAQVRGAEAVSVFVVGDSLADGEWHPPQDFRVLDHSFDIVYDSVVEALDGERTETKLKI
jgi:uridine phosphorylase